MDQWEEIYDKDYVHTLDQLRVLELADYYRVTPDWIREHMTPYEMREVSEYRAIKAQREQEAMEEARRDAER